MSFNFHIDKIVIACCVVKGAGKVNHRNRPSHGLALYTSGCTMLRFHSGKQFELNKNDIMYLPKHSNYDVSLVTPGDCYAINFDFEAPCQFEPFVLHTKNGSGFLEHFKTANMIWNKKALGTEMKCKAELYNILYMMQQEFSAGYIPNAKYKLILPAVDCIHQNYTQEPLSITELAALCNITPEYFRSIFKNYFGVSPLTYINGLKISRAKELLLSGMYTISEAALMSGYFDMSHFSREFKRIVGVSPSRYKGD